MRQGSVDAAVSSAASKVTYAGSGTAVTSWFFSSEFGVLCGIVLGVAGLAVNVWFKLRDDRRLQAEHEARMRGYGP